MTSVIQILRAIAFGPESLANHGQATPAPNVQGLDWGITEVTPGFVSIGATIVRVFSADNEV